MKLQIDLDGEIYALELEIENGRFTDFILGNGVNQNRFCIGCIIKALCKVNDRTLIHRLPGNTENITGC